MFSLYLKVSVQCYRYTITFNKPLKYLKISQGLFHHYEKNPGSHIKIISRLNFSSCAESQFCSDILWIFFSKSTSSTATIKTQHKTLTPRNNFSVFSKNPVSCTHTQCCRYPFFQSQIQAAKFSKNNIKCVLMKINWLKRGFPIAAPLGTSTVAHFHKTCIKKNKNQP